MTAAPPYDPQLPFLAELEATLHARAAAATATAPAGPDAVRVRRPAAGRVLRRALLLAGVTGLVGASAFATRSLVSGDEQGAGDPSLRTTTALQLGSGERRGEPWSLSSARRGRDLCDALIAGGAVATHCERPPGRDGIVLDGLLSPRSRYVAGLAGASVRAVGLRVGEQRMTVATRPASDLAAARAARLPPGLRWFVVVLPRDDGGGDGRRTVRARPLDRHGGPLGPAVVNIM